MRVYFGCFVTLILYVLFSLGDPQYEADRNRILETFYGSNGTRVSWERNIQQLIDFYRRYPNAVPQSQADKQEFEQFIAEYNNTPTQLIDGVPRQGGVVSTVVAFLAGKLGFRYIYSLFTQKKNDEKKQLPH
ncbi:protein Turandot X [Drosophila kikkawai]|uniref:Protein Turandot X n=1 Tax=Drosophila kikkawai TaxID=30033 RepID=A0ABM3C4B8_DROKI|nr:protein Turandot X [Drosophila kikkawai]